MVFLGALTIHKGPLVLLDAFEQATPSLPNWAGLVIAGSGPLEDEIASRAARQPRISYAGQLDPEQRDGLLVDASVLVIPSTWPENSPLVFFEALAAGVPVIAGDIGGWRSCSATATFGPSNPETLRRSRRH